MSQKSITKTLTRAGIVVSFGATAFAVAQPAIASAADWDAVAQCESGGNWSTSTGNGFSGGLQFTPQTWKAYGGSGDASSASRSEQIQVANKVLAAQGPGAWPNCFKGGTTSGSSEQQSSTQQDSSAQQDSYSQQSQQTQTDEQQQAPVQQTQQQVQQPVQQASGGDYTVQSGDTLSSIASKYGTTAGHLASVNGLSNPDVLSVGQELATA